MLAWEGHDLIVLKAKAKATANFLFYCSTNHKSPYAHVFKHKLDCTLDNIYTLKCNVDLGLGPVLPH